MHPNPNAPPTALRREQLRPNMDVMVIRGGNNPPERITIRSGVRSAKPSLIGRDSPEERLYVEVLTAITGCIDTRFLCDMGLVPYRGGEWSKTYVIRARS